MFFWSGSPYWKIKHWSKMSESEIMIHSIYGNRFISLSSLLPIFHLWYSLRIPEESYLIVFFPSIGLLGSVQSLGHVLLFATPWTAARQASLSITSSRSLSKLMSIMSVMPSNHLILCHPLYPPTFNLSQHQGLFHWVSSLHQVTKVLEFQLQHQSFQWTLRTNLL